MEYDQSIFDLCDLIYRSQEGTLTQIQQQQLDQWLEASPANRQLLEELQQQQALKLELQFFHRLDIQKGWEKIAAATGHAANELAVSAPVQVVHRSRIHIHWWAAAAIFMLVALIGAWLFKSGIHRTPSIAKTAAPAPAKEDVAPGGNKATLQLANGTIVNLMDTTAIQMMEEQDGTRISDTGGQLVYNNTAAGTEVLWNTLKTPRGGQFKVVLPDGSKVWLNAASSLKYPTHFSGNNRKVFLSGEGYFEIAKDVQHPFIVKTDTYHMDITVLGTTFNVSAYADEATVVTLATGAVNVQAGTHQTRLQPGQQALLAHEEGSIQTTTGYVETATAWKDGMFAFEQAGITDIMQQVARWYDVEVVFTGKVPTRRFSGHIRRQANLSQLLQMLELVGNVQFTITGKTITVK